jgi:hypothetical protein
LPPAHSYSCFVGIFRDSGKASFLFNSCFSAPGSVRASRFRAALPYCVPGRRDAGERNPAHADDHRKADGFMKDRKPENGAEGNPAVFKYGIQKRRARAPGKSLEDLRKKTGENDAYDRI